VQTTPPAPAQRGAKSTYDNLKGTAAWPPADVISAELLRQREPATRAVLRWDSETDSRFGRHSLKSCAKSFVRLHCQRATSCVSNYCEPNGITVVDQRRRSDLRREVFIATDFRFSRPELVPDVVPASPVGRAVSSRVEFKGGNRTEHTEHTELEPCVWAMPNRTNPSVVPTEANRTQVQ